MDDASLHYFYDDALNRKICSLKQYLGSTHQLHVFPEATIKNNQMPNGILIQSLQNRSIVLQDLLRDPGCGFFIFKLHGPSLVYAKEKIALDFLSFCEDLERQSNVNESVSENHLLNGIAHMNINKAIFANQGFSVKPEHLYLDIDEQLLAQDLSQVSNSIELKTLPDSEDTMVGFIHTGSEYFSRFILNPWQQRVTEYHLMPNHPSLDNIQEKFKGLDYLSEFAEEFLQDVRVAMNYCLFKRWWIFSKLKSFMNHQYGICLEPVSDRCHSGVFEIQNNLIQTRGIQLISKNSLPYMLAGQRETIAYLLYKKKGKNHPKYISHGTSYRVHPDYCYEKILGKQASLKFMNHLSQIYANTPLDKNNCLAYHYNIMFQKKLMEFYYFHWVPLLPLVNYQGKYLRQAQL